MALANSVTGDGILLDRSKVTRYFGRMALPVAGQYKEEVTEETREWVALTLSAAQTAVDANAQPETGQYSYRMSLEERIPRSYSLQRTLTLRTVTFEAD
jgi:hypothetical protein